MTAPLKTPGEVSLAIYGPNSIAGNHYAAGMRDRDEQIAEALEAEAKRAHEDEEAWLEGPGEALRAFAAKLRGAA